MTLQDIANYWNENEEIDTITLQQMIEDTDCIDDCGDTWKICHNDKEKVIIDGNGKAIVTNL